MADIEFTCPKCKEYLSVDAKGAGQIANCPKCSEKIRIPSVTNDENINPSEVDKLWTTLKNRTTEELIGIWVADDRKQWCNEAFVAIKKILTARGVPVTTPGQPVNYQQKTAIPPPSTPAWQQPITPARVIVADINMSFMSMIFFMVKWVLASIPAFIILCAIVVLVYMVFGGILAGIGAFLFTVRH